MSFAAKHILFTEGPDSEELRAHSSNKETEFTGDIVESLSGKVLEHGKKVWLRVCNHFPVCTADDNLVYQIEAQGTGDKCFAKGERVSFVYDATAGRSEEIPLT